jgi:AcrR family transcriptional regulator
MMLTASAKVLPTTPATDGGQQTVRPLRADARRNRARILAAAEQVFAARGASVSTEEIARAAGVGIGTVFRHFPTKEELLQAIIEEVVRQLVHDAERLRTEGDPATALFTFFARMVRQAAAKKTVVDLLSASGIDLDVAKPVNLLGQTLASLLAVAQEAGVVDDHVALPEVTALLIGTCHAALQTGWDDTVCERVLGIIFAGMSAPGYRRLG